MESVYQKYCILENCWLSIKNVLVKFATIIINYVLRHSFEPCEKYFKRVFWRFVLLQYLKAITYPMTAEKSKNSWSQDWMTRYALSAGILIDLESAA